MKTIYDFLADLKDKKVKLWLDGDQLRLKAPKGVLTKSIMQQIRARKSEIMLFLGQDVQNFRPPIKVMPRRSPLPLSYAQQRLWFLQQLEGPSATYNVPFAYRVSTSKEEPLQVVALEKALNEIVQRHEILRTTFPTVEGQPEQRIAPRLTLALTVVVLPPKEQRAELNRLLAEEARRLFDLTEGPLLRVTLYTLSDSQSAQIEYVLQVTMHHIISDGW